MASSPSSRDRDRQLMPPPPIPTRRQQTIRRGPTPYAGSRTSSDGSISTSAPNRELTASPCFENRTVDTRRSSTDTSGLTATSYADSTYPSISGSASRCKTGNRQARSTARSIPRATSVFPGCENREILCAVSEGRGVGPSVGLAFIDITLSRVILSQICDTQSYVSTIHKIRVNEPGEILGVDTAGPGHEKSVVYRLIEEELGTPVKTLPRSYWSENTGLDYVRTLSFPEDLESIQVSLQGNFYALCAFSAALKYLEEEAGVRVASHSLSIQYEPADNSVMIDISSIQSLELLQNSKNAKSKNCLFGLLNQTSTPMGARHLRSSILQPSTKREDITEKQEAVAELSSKEDMFFAIRKALKQLPDLEKVLTKLIVVQPNGPTFVTEQSINYVLQIKSFITAMPDLFDSLAAPTCKTLCDIRALCHPNVTSAIRGIIDQVIDEDAVYAKTPLDLRNQQMYAVKANLQGMLDVARQSMRETTDQLHDYVHELNTEFNFTNDIKYDHSRKYWLRFRESEFDDGGLPEILINAVHNKEHLECQTVKLVQYNMRITEASTEILTQSEKVIADLIEKLRRKVPSLIKLCQSIGLLDMLAGLARLVTVNDYCRPEITSTLALKEARHPITEKCVYRFVPNDYYARTSEHSFHIITGCNMSGKSTYIKTVAMLQVMAQIGSFVPAQYASFSIVNSIFTRMSKDDSVEANLSTFSMEMREMAFILRHIGLRSLAIIDELGRGTSTRDGLSIAIAISEALIESKALVLFATHFNELATILGSRPLVLNQHLQTVTTILGSGVNATQKVTMLHKIGAGPLQEDNYGINLAKAIGFPDDFIRKAQSVADALRAHTAAKKAASGGDKIVRRRRLVLNLHETLRQARESDMDDFALTSFLRRLQTEFVNRMEDIDCGHNEPSGSEANEQSDLSDESQEEEEEEGLWGSSPTRPSAANADAGAGISAEHDRVLPSIEVETLAR